MSKALDYLMQARPGTMGAYFDFLRRSGERLDPKTRALISVITKAANRTDRGLRQYVTRALEAGVTADEILDALLFAFPVLGLSRIVWAIDVLLDMDLPEFRPENLGVVPGWHELVAVSDLPSDGTHFTGAAGRSFIVHRSGDEISVYDNRCPHQSTELTAAGLEGDRLTCPKHGWQFDIRTGVCVAAGDKPLTRVEHKVEDGKVWVKR